MARLVFRYFNNLDLKRFKENYLIEIENNYNEKQISKEKIIEKSDHKAIFNLQLIKLCTNKDKIKNKEFDLVETLEFKKKILTHSYYPISESLIDVMDELSFNNTENNNLVTDTIGKFNILAVNFNKKIYQIFDENFNENGFRFNLIIKNIFDFLKMYIQHRKSYGFKFIELLNVEILIQLYRHLNFEDNQDEDYKQYREQMSKYILGFFIVFVNSCVLNLPLVIITSFKRYFYYLIKMK